MKNLFFVCVALFALLAFGCRADNQQAPAVAAAPAPVAAVEKAPAVEAEATIDAQYNEEEAVGEEQQDKEIVDVE